MNQPMIAYMSGRKWHRGQISKPDRKENTAQTLPA